MSKFLKFATALAITALAWQTVKAAEGDGPAPEEFQVKFETTAGDFIVDVHRDWAPRGVDRFHDAVKKGFYNECRFFRVVPGFVVQFGMNGNPDIQEKWAEARIPDDPPKHSNEEGTLTFANSGPNPRTTQLFINLADNARLDNYGGYGFAAFGKVSKGMDVVKKINAQYREQPSQAMITRRGNEYLNQNFPKLDYIKKATIVEKK